MRNTASQAKFASVVYLVSLWAFNVIIKETANWHYCNSENGNVCSNKNAGLNITFCIGVKGVSLQGTFPLYEDIVHTEIFAPERARGGANWGLDPKVQLRTLG